MPTFYKILNFLFPGVPKISQIMAVIVTSDIIESNCQFGDIGIMSE